MNIHRGFICTISIIVGAFSFKTTLAQAPSASNWQPAVTSNTALSALSSTYAMSIVRTGYASIGDSPPLVYTPTASACSLNSGAGDGGVQIPTSDSKCWSAHLPAANLPVTVWGVSGNGLTNNNNTFQYALNYVSLGNAATIPCGVYKLTTAMIISVPSNSTVSITGSGECTKLFFSGSNGFVVNLAAKSSNLIMNDMVLETDDSTNAYTAINASQTAAFTAGNARQWQLVTFRNIMMQGHDSTSTGLDYWGYGIKTTNISNVSIEDSAFWGSSPTFTNISISAAAPTLVTQANSHYVTGQPVVLGGTLPNGLTAGNFYYVSNPTGAGYNLSLTPGGAAINTAGSSTSSATVQPFGLGTALFTQGGYAGSGYGFNSYSVQYNVRNIQVYPCYTGLFIGDWVQGVTITQGSNFVGCAYGVYALPTLTAVPDQLVVSDSTFNTSIAGVDAPNMNGLAVHHDEFITNGSSYGIIGAGNAYAIRDNFFTSDPAGVGTAILINAVPSAGGIIAGNSIFGYAKGINFSKPGDNYSIVTNNVMIKTPIGYVINSGSAGVNITDDNLMPYSGLPPCNRGIDGAVFRINNGSAASWNATETGGGTKRETVICNASVPGWTAH